MYQIIDLQYDLCKSMHYIFVYDK